jgi:hypothetical protein
MNRIKKELEKLKRENQRLRKLAGRAEAIEPEVDGDYQEDWQGGDEYEAPEENRDRRGRGVGKKKEKIKRVDSKKTCPECREGELTIMELGQFRYDWCGVCKFRKKLR